MRLSLPYIAGFIDADGSISITKYEKPDSVHIRYALRITASNCDRRVPDAICVQFGGGVYQGTPKRGNHRANYNWIAVSKDAYKALKAIYPYMVIKKDQADVAIRLQESINKYKLIGASGRNIGMRFHPDRDSIMEKRQFFLDEMKRLKRVDSPTSP